MNKTKCKITAAVLVILLMCNLIIPCVYVFAQSNTITISSKKDFVKFARNCTLDTWSQGKVVNLTCDIDFEKSDFSPVPTFGGTFNGNGYTISGINILGSGSYLGLFRYVQQNGKITSLNVKATITPDGSKSYIGGIAGENCGFIENCSFDGTVKGENVIGGIAGNNADNGQIISCISAGTVTGENSTGGIAGKNEGLIISCTNNAFINTEYEDEKKDLEDINTDADAFVETYKSERSETEESSVLGHSDTGGIAGRTSGIVQGCTNKGTVGYPHIGYNVGGICGRQSGYLLGCRNYGIIQGRKDVGGIVGQMEPYILLSTSETDMKSIRSELNLLRSMVDNFIADTDSLGDNSRIHLDKIAKHAEAATDNAEILSDGITDFIDDNISEINSQTALISNTLDKLKPVFDDLEKAAEGASLALETISDAISEANLSFPEFADEIDDLSDAVTGLSKTEKSLKRAASRIGNAIDSLDNAIVIDNPKEVQKATSELSAAIKDFIAAKQSIRESLEKIEEILSTKPDSFEQIGINAGAVLECIKSIKTNTDTAISAIQTIGKSIDTLVYNTEINFYSLRSAAHEISSALSHLEDAASGLVNSMQDISREMKDLSDVVQDYTDTTAEEIKKLKDKTAGALELLSNSMEDIADAIDNIGEIVSDLAEEEPAEFVKLGDDIKDAGVNLFDSLSGISNEMDLLKSTLTDGRNSISRHLSSINNQFNVIMNLMIDRLEQFSAEDNSLSDRFLDVSDEDIRSVKQGKVAECKNYGSIEADRNTGGIVGAMSVEYTKDPEDDIEKPDKFNFTYKAKAVLYYCVNQGEVIAKKDCAGGIVGFEEIGTVYGCENYADTKSNNGKYVGGIAGKSESSIRKSFSKCKMSGKKYVGGIAGMADTMSLNYAIVNPSGEEYIGSICGDCKDKALINRNYFVDSGLGAIDGISYKDRAEPITFDEIKGLQDVPDKFISFKVDFMVNDEVISTQEIKYGDKTSKILYPDIPEKKGHFGVWQKPEAEYVTENIQVICEYKPYITLLSSEEKTDSGKLALALAEGEFTDEARLNIKESEKEPPKNSGSTSMVYDISLSNTDIEKTDPVTLRILNENKDKVTAWHLKDGEWEQLKTSDRGKYTVLQTRGTHSVICLKYTKKGFSFIWLILIVLAGCACTLFLKRKGK